MLRKLLACLALLTGLAAAGTPAQAEVARALASPCEVTATAPGPVRSSPVAVLGALLPPPETVLAEAAETLSGRPAPLPAVRLGSDRARE